MGGVHKAEDTRLNEPSCRILENRLSDEIEGYPIDERSTIKSGNWKSTKWTDLINPS
jgi:hypothetical protein